MTVRLLAFLAAAALAGCDLNLDKSLLEPPTAQDAAILDASVEAGIDASEGGEAGKVDGGGDADADGSKEGSTDAASEDGGEDVLLDSPCAPFAVYGPCSVCAADKCCPELTTCMVDGQCQVDLAVYLDCATDGGGDCLSTFASSTSGPAPALAQCLQASCSECP